MHYRGPSHMGLEMKISLNYLILEFRNSIQPLHESYKKYGQRKMASWIKSFWEKCDELDINVEFNNITIEIPQTNDK